MDGVEEYHKIGLMTEILGIKDTLCVWWRFATIVLIKIVNIVMETHLDDDEKLMYIVKDNKK